MCQLLIATICTLSYKKTNESSFRSIRWILWSAVICPTLLLRESIGLYKSIIIYCTLFSRNLKFWREKLKQAAAWEELLSSWRRRRGVRGKDTWDRERQKQCGREIERKRNWRWRRERMGKTERGGMEASNCRGMITIDSVSVKYYIYFLKALQKKTIDAILKHFLLIEILKAKLFLN